MMEAETPKKRRRGQGKGSNFFVLSRKVWNKLLNAETANRLNLATTYLVLLAGTGSDHQLTKWSATACEQYAGIGKPRAKRSIDELIAAKIIKATASSTKNHPQYQLPAIAPEDEDVIYLPVQLVTGFGLESSMLRRVREAGDFLTLRMLIDFYGMLELDATYGISPSFLRSTPPDGVNTRKAFEVGAYAVWSVPEEATTRHAAGNWTINHRSDRGWDSFWERLATLRKIGAVYFEPWIYEHAGDDAEPLFPVDPGVLYSSHNADDVAALTRKMIEAADVLAQPTYRYLEGLRVPLNAHQQAPVLRGVAKLRIEADTAGRRMAYAHRKAAIERVTAAFDQLSHEGRTGNFSKPLNYHMPKTGGFSNV